MHQTVLNPTLQASQVREQFRVNAAYWRDLYDRPDSVGAIFRDRQSAALEMIDELALPAGAEVLEVGFGAGYITAELARRGFRVTAIDSTPEMLDVARGMLSEELTSGQVVLGEGDVHALDFADGSFQLVVALGVIPWLHSPAQGLREMARLLVPGGHLVVTSDNRARLNHLLDPAFSPLLERPRQALGSLRRRLTGQPADLRFHPHLIWTWRFRAMVQDAGLEVQSERTIGFGPFSLFAHPLFRGDRGMGVHGALQALGDRGAPVFRSAGSHQVVLARRPVSAVR